MPSPGQHSFSEKVALVTNGTSPIGRAVAMQLALYGCYVITTTGSATGEERSAVEELRSLGTLADSIEIDPVSIGDEARIVDRVSDLYGRLDLLVNCLIPEIEAPFDEITEAEFAHIVNTVLRPAIFLTREAVRLMDARPGPRIVNVVRNRPGGSPAFVASALNASVSSLASSLSNHLPSRYRINTVAVNDSGSSADARETLDPDLFRAPSKVDPDDVARAVMFLLSSEAKGVNGRVLEIG